jgi:hypothetical protein
MHVVLKSKRSNPAYFRGCWNRIEYACREPNASLKPVPSGFTREILYCGHCRAEKCLFTNDEHDHPSPRPDGRKTAPARARARGLAGNGRPLIPNCWNCEELRCKLGGYVCRYEPEEKPVSPSTMMARKVAEMGCNRFGLRRVMEIPPLDGERSEEDSKRG